MLSIPAKLHLIANEPLTCAEKREVALKIMRLARSTREAQRLPDTTRADFLDK